MWPIRTSAFHVPPQEKAEIDARMAQLERDGARLMRHVKNYTVRWC